MSEIRIKPVEGYRLIAGYLGYITMLVAFIILLMLLTLVFYPQEVDNAKYFLIPGISALILGYALTFLIKDRDKGQLKKGQDAVIVAFSWLIAVGVCALPFVLTGQYNFTQGVFEATSGFSTTGLSVVDVARAPKIFLMYRSSLQFFGGIGLVLVMMSVLSDVYGMRLYNAEGHFDKLLPNLISSVRLIMAIYSGYIVSGMALYILFGMHPFDALNHAIAAVATGGFSTKPESIGFYNSVPIDIVTIVLMLLGNTNFLVHLLLIKGKFKACFEHCEIKFVIVFLAITCPLFAFLFMYITLTSFPESFRIATFQMVSALTGTGFQTIKSFNGLNSSLMFLLILAMVLGGGAGSTAGGIKQYRVYLIFKQFYWTIRDMMSHKRLIRVDSINRFGKTEIVTEKTKKDVSIFAFTYIVIFFLGSFIFSLFGYSIEQSAFEFSSAFGTVGLSVGITGYNAHPIILWTSIIGMIVGRLEIYVVFIAIIRLSQDLYKKYNV